MSNVLDLVAKITLDTTEYDRGLESSKSKVGGFGTFVKKGLGSVAGLAVKGLGIASGAATAFGLASVKTGMTFDSSMAQVAATMGKTSAQMESEVASVDLSWGKFTGNLREYAQEMGANTVFSASQAADALNYMALAGYDTEKSMKTLPTVMNLASAGAMDLATASDMVTDTETALGLESERTTHLIDEMAKTASTTNTSVAQLGSAILTIGGTAKQLKGGFVEMADGSKQAYDGTTELSAALGILADNGIKGSAAGTTLRNMLTSMTGTKWAKTFGDLGVSVYDATGEMRSMKDILADMSKAMDGMTTEEKTSLITKTFNARDLKSINALLATTGDRWDQIITGLNDSGEAGVMYAGQLYSMEEAQKKFGDSIYDTEAGFKVLGAAEMMAYQQMDNLSGDITLFKSALEGAQIALSDKVTPSLRDFVKIGSAGLSEFTNKVRSGDLSGAIASLGESIGNIVVVAAKKVPDMIKAGAMLLKGIGQGIAQNAGEIISAAQEVVIYLYNGIVDNAPKMIDSALSMVQNLGNGLVKGIPDLLSKALPLIEQFTGWLHDNAGRFIDAGLGLIQNLAQGIANSIPVLVQHIPQIVTNIASIIVDNAPKVLKAGVNIIKTLAKGIVDAIPTIKENIPKIIEAIVTTLKAIAWLNVGKTIIVGIGKAIIAVVNLIVPFLASIATAIIGFFQTADWLGIASTILTGIGNAIVSIASAIAEFLAPVFEAIAGTFGGLWDALTEKVSAVWETISNAVQVGIMLICEILNAAVEILMIPWNFIWENFGEYITGAWETIKGIVSGALDAISTTISNVWNAIVSFLSPILETIKNAISSAWNAVSSTVSSVLNAISSVVSNIWNSITSFLSEKLEAIKSRFSDIWNNIKTNVSTAVDTIKTNISDKVEAAKTAVTDKLDGIKQKFTDIFDNIKSHVSGVVDWLKGIFDFHWELPHIALPHFSIEGSFSLNPPSVPHFSIDWWKEGYENPFLIKFPTILGNQGFGDRGAHNGGELVYSHDKLMEDIRKASGGNRTFAPVINIYTREGQSNEEIAQYVMDRMKREYERAGKVYT